MARRRVACAVMVVGIALLAGACGGSGDDAGTSGADAAVEDDTEPSTTADPRVADGAAGAPNGGPDVCALLEGVDRDVLLGEPAGEPHQEGSVCRVGPADATSRGQLGLVVETDRPSDNYQTQKDVFGVDTEVTGLGDGAFHSGGYLFVLDGNTFFFLQVVRDASRGQGVADEDLEAAAETIIENLDQ